MNSSSSSSNIDLEGFYYRVHGKVQGVYFRKYTQQKALELGVTGWIRNDKTNGTVEGQVLCERRNSDGISPCAKMKVWLQSQGSPMSLIDYTEITSLSPDELHKVWNNNSPAAFEIRKTFKGKRR